MVEIELLLPHVLANDSVDSRRLIGHHASFHSKVALNMPQINVSRRKMSIQTLQLSPTNVANGNSSQFVGRDYWKPYMGNMVRETMSKKSA